MIYVAVLAALLALTGCKLSGEGPQPGQTVAPAIGSDGNGGGGGAGGTGM